MTKILFITVGGSHQPIVTSIQILQPDRVIFICSDGNRGSKSQVIGEGTPCEVRRGNEILERLPNIPQQAKLGDRFQPNQDLVLIQEPDDLAECYVTCSAKIQQIQQQIPDAQLMADYTGGTKSMSVGLSMAALDYRSTLYLTTATRTNIIRVDRGEITGQVSISPVVVQRVIEQFLPVVLEQYNYPAAITELKRLLPEMALPSEIKRKLHDLHACCCGLDAWDRFNHREALEFLIPYMQKPSIKEVVLFLKRVIDSRSKMDSSFSGEEGSNGNGYEIVEDLLLNAERRATQQRYDDAVGRLYRALELLAQIRLQQQYEIQTDDVDLNKLPEALHSRYEQRQKNHRSSIQLALRESYQLLAELDDRLGDLYKARENRVIDSLKIRNNSLFAHGFQPISNGDYQKFSETVSQFIREGITAVVHSKKMSQAIQFPTSLDF
ncbi:MAG: TIGR02710 family CRISPR-associated protein [Leptolyngbyaceae cyanobacterium SU_3_3]|nr:TIGR02710 family CRISPR-associated protein [Leptolyngbyaceae cyanobacterium SU_3_3]